MRGLFRLVRNVRKRSIIGRMGPRICIWFGILCYPRGALAVMDFTPAYGDEPPPWKTTDDVPDPVCFSITALSHNTPNAAPFLSRAGIVYVSKKDTLMEVKNQWSEEFSLGRFNFDFFGRNGSVDLTDTVEQYLDSEMRAGYVYNKVKLGDQIIACVRTTARDKLKEEK